MPQSITRPLTVADTLQSARARVRFALRCVDEGDVSVDTFDAVSRALVAATSELNRVAVELDVLLRNPKTKRDAVSRARVTATGEMNRLADELDVLLRNPKAAR